MSGSGSSDGDPKNTFTERLRFNLLADRGAAPLPGPAREVEVAHPVHGRRTYTVEPWLRLGGDGWVWCSKSRVADRHAVARILDALAQSYPAAAFHLLIYPTSPSGQTPCWALEKSTYSAGEQRSLASGLVLGEGEGGWEAVAEYLSELADRSANMHGSALREFWKEGLNRASCSESLEAKLDGLWDAKPRGPWRELLKGLHSHFAGLSSPRMAALWQAVDLQDSESRTDLTELCLAWLLNRPEPRKVHPWKGRSKPNITPDHAIFAEAWGDDDFPELIRAPELGPFVRAFRGIRPLAFEGQKAAGQWIAEGDETWAIHLASTSLRDIVRSSLKESRKSGVDVEDLFQEGLLGALHAAERYEPVDEDGTFRPFRGYAAYWIWQRVQYYHQALGGLIRRPPRHHQRVYAAQRAWWSAPSGVPDHQVLTPVLPLEASLFEPFGDGGMTMREALQGGWSGGMRPETGVDEPTLGTRIADLLGEAPDADASLLQEEVLEVVQKALPKLPPRDGQIIRDHWGLDGFGVTKTLEEIGTSLNVSRERVRQLEERSFERLRNRAKFPRLHSLGQPWDLPPAPRHSEPSPARLPVARSGPGSSQKRAPSFDLDPMPILETFSRNPVSIRRSLEYLELAFGLVELANRLKVGPPYIDYWKSGHLPQRKTVDRIEALLRACIVSTA